VWRVVEERRFSGRVREALIKSNFVIPSEVKLAAFSGNFVKSRNLLSILLNFNQSFLRP
jgi:hypothetical protein